VNSGFRYLSASIHKCGNVFASPFRIVALAATCHSERPSTTCHSERPSTTCHSERPQGAKNLGQGHSLLAKGRFFASLRITKKAVPSRFAQGDTDCGITGNYIAAWNILPRLRIRAPGRRVVRGPALAAIAMAGIFCAYAGDVFAAETSVTRADLDAIKLEKPELDADVLFAGDRFTRATIKRVYDELSPALVVVQYAVEFYDRNTQRTRKRSGYCLGVLVRPDGLVMVPGHVQMQDAKPIDVRVKLVSEREYDAHVLPKDKNLNVTFFQIDSSERLELPYVEFVDRSLDVGESVMVMGILTPGMDYARTFKLGRVSAVVESPRKVYPTTVSVPLGLMGGPVIDVRGNAIGVMGRDLAPSEGGDIYVRYDYPVVYPTETFAELVENPPTTDRERPRNEAWIGIFTQPLSDGLAEYWGVEPTGGIVVSGVIPRSPAERAGLKRGDIVKEIDGIPVTARQDAHAMEFTRIVREVGPNKTIPLKILRDRVPIEVDVTLALTPKKLTEADRYEDKQFGLTVREITVDVILYGELDPTIQGVVVHRVVSAGWAALAGLEPDDIILTVGEQDITGLDDFRRVLDELRTARPDEIVIKVQRGSRTAFFRIEPKWDAA